LKRFTEKSIIELACSDRELIIPQSKGRMKKWLIFMQDSMREHGMVLLDELSYIRV
jgi:hypothetical protein